MSLVTNCSRTFLGVLLVLVALALLACLPPAAHAQLAQLTLFVAGTGDPSPVPACFSVIIGFAMLETPGLPATAVDVAAPLTAQAGGSLSCPSLRAAIRHANTNGNSATDRIVLQGGSIYTLGIRGPNEDNALTGDLDIRSNVRITANATALGASRRSLGGPAGTTASSTSSRGWSRSRTSRLWVARSAPLTSAAASAIGAP